VTLLTTPMGITMGEAALLALFLETFFYGALPTGRDYTNIESQIGVFLTLYWLTLFILFKGTVIQRQFLIPVATLLLCIATAVGEINSSLEE